MSINIGFQLGTVIAILKISPAEWRKVERNRYKKGNMQTALLCDLFLAVSQVSLRYVWV